VPSRAAKRGAVLDGAGQYGISSFFLGYSELRMNRALKPKSPRSTGVARAGSKSDPREARRAASARELIVVKDAIFDHFRDAFDDGLDRLFRPEPESSPALQLIEKSGELGPRRGLRDFLRPNEGEGYWDVFKPSDHLIITVTDAVYRQDKLLRISGRDFFKLRILIAGELRDESGQLLARGPQGLLFVGSGHCETSYRIAAGQPIRMVVLHARQSMLTHALGLDPQSVPPPLDALSRPSAGGSVSQIALHPEVFHAAQRMIESRLDVGAGVRLQFLEALGTVMILDTIQDLRDSQQTRSSEFRWGKRDLNRVLEARDYLSQHFAKPPRIPELARLVGINQTKLKAGFRQAVGTTVYKFVLRCRMQRASELLLGANHTVSEVGFLVGYEHPPNFTSAFRRFYGCLPRSWRHPPLGEPALESGRRWPQERQASSLRHTLARLR
jgi:AraC-like DNA-binding protein